MISHRLSDDELDTIENTRSKLIASGHYIGDPMFPYGNYVWLRCGREERVVLKQDARDFLSSEQKNPPPYPSHAVLSTIGLITSDQYFLTSCGMWKGARELAPDIPFVDVKPSCLLTTPPGSDTRDDFVRGLQVLQRFADRVQRGRDTQIKGLFRQGRFNESRIRLRHVLFEVKDASGDDSTQGGSLHSASFSMP
jgi:hypothetical protein